MPQNLKIILGSTYIFWTSSTTDSLANYTCKYEQSPPIVFILHMLEKMELNRSLGLTVWMNLLHITFLSPLQKKVDKNDYQ